jgi:hypothetical protein
MFLCLLGLRLWRLLISAACKTVSINRSGVMFMLMLMIVVKSQKKETLLDDLKETFDNL